MDGKHHAGLALRVVAAVERPRHRRHEGNVQIGAAKAQARGRIDRQAHDAVDDALWIEADEPTRIHLDAPHIAVGIDGGAIGIACQPPGKRREVAARSYVAALGVVVIGKDGLLEAVGKIEGLAVRTPAGAVRADDAAIQGVHGEIGIEAEKLSDRLALRIVHRTRDEAALPVDDALDLARAEIEEMESAAQRQDGAALLAQRHRADRLRQRPGFPIAAFEVGAMNGRSIGVDPIEPFALRVPEWTFSELILLRREDFDSQRHRRSQFQNATLSAPLSPRICRASSGVAISRPRFSISCRARVTCSALDLASWPGPIHSESSRPTRTLPPMATDMTAIGSWLRPAPRTDQ